ncbi:MAG: hypothetical protein HFH61_06490 [Lachnospiraceae bacterium]|nr:hypothetical protein [Lachnospiraceae bacterium]
MNEENEVLEDRLVRVEKQIQNQQNEIKNVRKCMLCIGIVLALSQAVSAYNNYIEREASLTLAESNLKNEQIALKRAQNETSRLKLFEKVMEFLSSDPEFREFFREDPEPGARIRDST